jgi:hypothetical protein
MTSESIVDNKLFVRLDLDHSLRANSFFLTNPSNRAHLAGQLLLYDSIIIPTTDFGIIPILISWFGLKTFEATLDTSALRFVRRNGILGYAGNGVGISGFSIQPRNDRNFEWWQEAIFGENSGTTIDLQLEQMCPFISNKQRIKLVEQILTCSSTLSYDNDFFMKNIVHESYMDILENEDLSKFVITKENNKEKTIDLTRLTCIKPNETRVLSQDGMVNDAADLVLRASEINMEIVMATSLGNTDIYISKGSEKVLAKKLSRCKLDKSLVESFISLLELNNIPDIRHAVLAGGIDLPRIWSLRNRKISENFRKWLREVDPKNGRDLEKAYIEALGGKAFSESLPIKTLRFVITSLAGLNPAVGLITSAIDSFFVDKWLSGYSPKLFLDELSKLPKQKHRH